VAGGGGWWTAATSRHGELAAVGVGVGVVDLVFC
jgi:hypothetical protein